MPYVRVRWLWRALSCNTVVCHCHRKQPRTQTRDDETIFPAAANRIIYFSKKANCNVNVTLQAPLWIHISLYMCVCVCVYLCPRGAGARRTIDRWRRVICHRIVLCRVSCYKWVSHRDNIHRYDTAVLSPLQRISISLLFSPSLFFSTLATQFHFHLLETHYTWLHKRWVGPASIVICP